MPRYYDFKVSLDGIEPQAWRRFLLPDDATFAELDAAIIYAGPWEGDHLSAFHGVGKNKHFRASGSGEKWGEELEESEVPLGFYFKRKGQKCGYIYDFGDSWEHVIEFMGMVETEEEFERRLVGGARAWPLEDSGGLWGYGTCVEAAKQRDSGAGEEAQDDKDEDSGEAEESSDAEQRDKKAGDEEHEEDEKEEEDEEEEEDDDYLWERIEWIGDWDPEEFDLDKTKKRFDIEKRLKRRGERA
jgi:hypothetical protein